MPMALCPKGHASADPDYCDVCGTRIGAASRTVAATTAAPDGATCPDCGTPRVAGSRFCEVCRHDFSTGDAGPRPAAVAADRDAAPATPKAALAQAAAPAAAPPPVPAVGQGPGDRADVAVPIRHAWAEVTCDRSLMRPGEDAPFPADEPVRSYPLDLDETLVGRRNGRAGVHPEIPLADPSASARHLKIARHRDGSLHATDIGSTNGTARNGQALEAGVEVPLAAGDELTLGAWTRIRIVAR